MHNSSTYFCAECTRPVYNNIYRGSYNLLGAAVVLYKVKQILNLFGNSYHSGTIVYDAYIDGLIKIGNAQKAIQIFQRMKRDCCQPSTDTYTMLINLYGKVSSFVIILISFAEFRF